MILRTDGGYGDVTVSNAVVAQIAGQAASRCYGVVGMASRNTKDGIVSLLKPDNMTKGINVSVVEGGVVVELHIIVEYGVNINTICKSIVNHVKYSIENTVGIKVTRADVKVEGVRVDE